MTTFDLPVALAVIQAPGGGSFGPLIFEIAAFAAIFEPLMILGMGVVVLVIVLAILLPIFQLNQLVGK